MHVCYINFSKIYRIYQRCIHKIRLLYQCSWIWSVLKWRDKKSSFYSSPVDLWTGSASQGHAILNGFFIIYNTKGHLHQYSWSSLEELFFQCNAYFAPYLYSFEWLRDLKATGEMSARRLTRRMIEYWIENELSKESKRRSKIISPIVTARRLSSWILLYEFFGSSARDTFKRIFFKGIQGEYRALKRSFFKKMTDHEKIILLKALLEYNIYVEYDASCFEVLLFEVHDYIVKINHSILLECHSPQSIYESFCKIIEIRNVLTQWEKSFLYIDGNYQKTFQQVFNVIQNVLKLMMQLVRFYRHSNGELCQIKKDLLQNKELIDSIRINNIDIALSQIDTAVKSQKIQQKGVIRFDGKHTVLFVNIMLQPPLTYRLQGYDKNLLPNVMNLEWSVESSVMIHQSECAVYHKNQLPAFFYNNAKASKEREFDLLEDYTHHYSSKEFYFKGVNENKAKQIYQHEREISLISTAKNLTIKDTFSANDLAEDPILFMKFILNENMKIVAVNYENGAKNGSIILESGPVLALRDKKTKKTGKQKKRCVINILATHPIYLDIQLLHNYPVLTIMGMLESGNSSIVHSSFIIEKI